MAASYDPIQATAKDRVRKLVFDKAATFRFQDEEIAFELTEQGFVGDPLDTTATQSLPELKAAISLVESLPSSASSSSGDSVTIKQGSWSRTSSAGSLGNYDRTNILRNLRRRLTALYAQSGDGGPSVTDGYANWPCETVIL